MNLSVKVTALTARVNAEAPELGIEDASHRLRKLLRTAKEVGAHLHVDMESMESRELITELVIKLLNEPEFKDGPSAGIVLQAYLRDADEQLDRLLEGIQQPFTIRLVKGAYWEHETVEAKQHGWTAPVYEAKIESDRSFERLTKRLIAERPHVKVAIASHNVRSIAHALALAPDRDLEFQVLRGLGDDLQEALTSMGLRVRTYCPVGDLVAGMSYLVRRLLENTSNDSFLLSRSPRGRPGLPAGGSVSSFTNEPLLELRRAPVRDGARRRARRARPAAPVARAGDHRRRAPRRADAAPPSTPARPTAIVAHATVATDTRRRRSRQGRGRTPPPRGRPRAPTSAPRSSAAPPASCRQRRPLLAALAVRECAQAVGRGRRRRLRGDRLPRVLRAAGDRARRAERPRPAPRRAQHAPLRRPRRGRRRRPVELPARDPRRDGRRRPRDRQRRRAQARRAVARAARSRSSRPSTRPGCPKGALNLLPGEGETGAALVAHPGVHTIAFTGSGAVGLSILKTAAELAPGQRHLKRVVAEMGGKNCVIVDADADLDDVVPALAYSAFGFAGQKCSAAARALVHERIADTLLERLHGAVEALLIDQAQRFGVDVPPVIERAAQERINGFIATAHEQGARVFQPGQAPEHGFFVAPAVIDRLPRRLARHRGGDLRPRARRRGGRLDRRGVRDRRQPAVRAHRRAVLAATPRRSPR